MTVMKYEEGVLKKKEEIEIGFLIVKMEENESRLMLLYWFEYGV